MPSWGSSASRSRWSTSGWIVGCRQRSQPTAGPTLVYASISLVGAILFLPIVVAAYLTSDMRLTGLGLIVVGLATLQWWRLRRAAHDRPPRRLALVARLALAAAVMAGLVAEVPEIAGALGA